MWKLIEAVLPPWLAKAPGPRPVPDRLCLQGILFVLHTRIGWKIYRRNSASAPG